MNQDQLRDQASRLEELAMLLFEQQFIRHGGRKPGDPEWGDDSVDRDDWRDRARDVAPLLADRDAELERWRTGLRRRSWPTVTEVPDGITYAARLVREQGTEGGDEHDRLLREAAVRLERLYRVASHLLADRDRVEASRRDWATEAVGLREKLERLENLALNTAALHSGMLVGIGGEHDPVPSDEQCLRAAGLIERAIRRGMGPGYVTQAELRLLAAIEAPQGLCACLTPEGAEQVAAQPKWALPQCSVHPDRGGKP